MDEIDALDASCPLMEQKVGDDLHRKSGIWHRLERLIDRRNDQYRELITNPQTGEVIGDVDEPLSQHQVRGDAKKSPRT